MESTENVDNSLPSPESLLAEKDREIGRLKDQHVRLMAEFDNFRKRTVREKSDLMRYGGEEVMTALLPVLDDFERTLIAIEKSDNLTSIRDGIRMVTENFFKALHKKGLEQIPSVNQNFDSNLHEAVTSVSMGDEKKGLVIDEVEKGYKLHDKVIRFSKVIVGE